MQTAVVLADVILQAERGGADGGPPFEWVILLDIGDLSGSQTPPDDEEGKEVVRGAGRTGAFPCLSGLRRSSAAIQLIRALATDPADQSGLSGPMARWRAW